MKVVILASLLIGFTNAFSPVSHQPSKAAQTTLQSALDDIGGATAPAKNFDPLSLSTVGGIETLRWFRAAELKHSRIAMLAVTGYLVQASGFHFPGMLSSEVSFADLSAMNPFDAWEAVPNAGKAQIISLCFIAELSAEKKGIHYTQDGGKLPEVVFPKFNFSKVEPEIIDTKRKRELNNGRLAMIGIASFVAAHDIPGSVPALKDIAMF